MKEVGSIRKEKSGKAMMDKPWLVVTMKVIFIIFLQLFISGIALASQVNLAETGQTISYASGDDGMIQAGVPWPHERFTDNGNGTVTDNLTGLMWLRDANCFGIMNQQDALDQIAYFNDHPKEYVCDECAQYTASYDDWRLPNLYEWETLCNLGVPINHEWLSEQGFVNIGSTGYYAYHSSHPGLAYNIYSYCHIQNWPVNIEPADVLWPVWPVRAEQSGDPDPEYPSNIPRTGMTTCYDLLGEVIDCEGTGQDGELRKGVSWPEPRFTIQYCDGTGPCADQSSDCDDNPSTDVVKDHLTGLTWARDANLPNDGVTYFWDGRSWQEALDYANTLCLGGHSDWRLPNRHELYYLASVVDGSYPSEFVDIIPFTGTHRPGFPLSYWSSSSVSPDYSGLKFILHGRYIWHAADNTSAYHVWPVRGNIGPYRFVVMADSRSKNDSETPRECINESGLKSVMESVKGLYPPPKFIVFVGDMAYGRKGQLDVENELDAWRSIIDEVMSPEANDPLKPSDSSNPFLSYTNKKIYPVFGGHEQVVNGTDKWLAFDNVFFSDPNDQRALPRTYFNTDTTDLGRTVYFFDYGNARFFVLNNDLPVHEFGEAQIEWVTGILENSANKKPLNFFFHHEPAYGTGAHGSPPPNAMDRKASSRSEYINLLGQNNATMIFAGHEHQYTRRLINADFANLDINKGMGPRTAESYDGNSDNAPLLYIKWKTDTSSGIVTKRVSNKEDDAEELGDGSMDLYSSDLELMLDSARDPSKKLQNFVGMRWTQIDIPQGANITSAYIQFTTDEIGDDPAEIRFYGEYTDDAKPFTGTNGELGAKVKTTNYTKWGLTAWNKIGQNEEGQRTPDLKAIIQEIVDRSEWRQNNAIVIFATHTIHDVSFTGGFYEVKTGSSGAPWYEIEKNDYLDNCEVKLINLSLSTRWSKKYNEPYHYAVVDVAGDDVRTVTIHANGGTFAVSYNDQTTPSLNYNVTATAFQSVLEALSNIGENEVVVTGGPSDSTPYVLTSDTLNFDGLTIDDSSLTRNGGTGTAAVNRRVTLIVYAVDQINEERVQIDPVITETSFGDNDQDGAPDIVRIISPTGAGDIVVDLPEDQHPGISLSNVTATTDTHFSLDQETKPDNDFPFGLVGADITGIQQGETVIVTLILPTDVPVGYKYYGIASWHPIEFDSNDGDNRITVSLIDGGTGDRDGKANCVISHLGGLAAPKTVIVNDPVTFEPIGSTYRSTYDTTGCTEGFVGKFSFDARLTNTSDSSLTDLVVKVAELTNNNLLQNTDGGPGGIGSQLTVSMDDDYSDGVLGPGESIIVPFTICLKEFSSFRFFVDVLGTVR